MGSDINWGTVERLDGPLSEADSGQQEEVLHVPELTTDLLVDLEESEARTQHEAAQETTQDRAQTGEAGSQVACEICGKQVRVRKDGLLSKHKCEPRPARGDRFDNLPTRTPTTPRKVRTFVIGVSSWAVEEGTATLLARPFGADPDDVPTELPDPDMMLGPPIDLVWPAIPERAQKFIEACADNSDLIACALAWGDWMRTLNAWRRDQIAYNTRLIQERASHGTSQSAGANVVTGAFQPFNPA